MTPGYPPPCSCCKRASAKASCFPSCDDPFDGSCARHRSNKGATYSYRCLDGLFVCPSKKRLEEQGLQTAKSARPEPKASCERNDWFQPLSDPYWSSKFCIGLLPRCPRITKIQADFYLQTGKFRPKVFISVTVVLPTEADVPRVPCLAASRTS